MNNAASVEQFEGALTLLCRLCTDMEYIENEEKKRVMIAVDKLFREGHMTEKQKRRFIQRYIHGLTLRQIAVKEAVYVNSVADSLKRATDKLKRYFEKI